MIYKKAPEGGKLYLFWNCTAGLVLVAGKRLERAADFMSRALPRTNPGSAMLLVTGDHILRDAFQAVLAGHCGVREVKTARVLSLPFNWPTVASAELSADEILELMAGIDGVGTEDQITGGVFEFDNEEVQADLDAHDAEKAAAEAAEAAAAAEAEEAEKAEAAAAAEKAAAEAEEATAAADAEAAAEAARLEAEEATAAAAEDDESTDDDPENGEVEYATSEAFNDVPWDELAAQMDDVADFKAKELAEFGQVFSPHVAQDGKKSARVAELLAARDAVTSE